MHQISLRLTDQVVTFIHFIYSSQVKLFSYNLPQYSLSTEDANFVKSNLPFTFVVYALSNTGTL